MAKLLIRTIRLLKLEDERNTRITSPQITVRTNVSRRFWQSHRRAEREITNYHLNRRRAAL